MKRLLKYFLLPALLLILYLALSKQAFAGVTISTANTTINSEDEVTINIDILLQGQGNITYYIEGAFKPVAGTNYSGFTWNDTSWVPYISSTGYEQLKQITTDSTGKWSGFVKVKIDSGSKYFTGSGQYIFKIKRFTATGNDYWSDNQIDFNVISNSPTPTTTASPTPSSTPFSTRSTFLISSENSTINSQQVLPIKVELTNLQANNQYYLKGVFYQDGLTNYFGKTQVNNTWITSSQNYSQQSLITTDSNGNWNGTVNLLPDINDTGFSGSSNYMVKIGRYTSSGSGPTWSNSLEINIQEIKPTPTPAYSPAINPPTSTTGNIYNPSPFTTSRNIDNLSNLDDSTNSATIAGALSFDDLGENKFQGYIIDIKWPFITMGAITLVGGSILFFKVWKKGIFCSKDSNHPA